MLLSLSVRQIRAFIRVQCQTKLALQAAQVVAQDIRVFGQINRLQSLCQNVSANSSRMQDLRMTSFRNRSLRSTLASEVDATPPPPNCHLA